MIIQEKLYCFQLARRSQRPTGVSATLRFRDQRAMNWNRAGGQDTGWLWHWRLRGVYLGFPQPFALWELINSTDQWPPHQGRRTMGFHSGEYFGFEVREEPGSNPDCGSPLFTLPYCLSHLQSVFSFSTLSDCMSSIYIYNICISTIQKYRKPKGREF